MLEKLENFQNNEPVMIEGNTAITIEHIFPQNPSPQWKNDIGIDDFNYIKTNYIDTIANLTLTGSNAQLSNKTFQEKRDMAQFGYKESRLWLNKQLAKADKWDKKEVEKRFEAIAERFLNWKTNC